MLEGIDHIHYELFNPQRHVSLRQGKAFRYFFRQAIDKLSRRHIKLFLKRPAERIGQVETNLISDLGDGEFALSKDIFSLLHSEGFE